jgi:hypothetical protein
MTPGSSSMGSSQGGSGGGFPAVPIASMLMGNMQPSPSPTAGSVSPGFDFSNLPSLFQSWNPSQQGPQQPSMPSPKQMAFTGAQPPEPPVTPPSMPVPPPGPQGAMGGAGKPPSGQGGQGASAAAGAAGSAAAMPMWQMMLIQKALQDANTPTQMHGGGIQTGNSNALGGLM